MVKIAVRSANGIAFVKYLEYDANVFKAFFVFAKLIFNRRFQAVHIQRDKTASFAAVAVFKQLKFNVLRFLAFLLSNVWLKNC